MSSEGGFDKVTCTCGHEAESVAKLIEHAQIEHGTDVE